MIKTARKYKIGVDFINIKNETKKKLPIFHHMAITNHYLWNKPAAKCLKNLHNIITVEDMENFAYSTQPMNPNRPHPDRCLNIATLILAELPDKYKVNINEIQTEHTPNRLRKYKKTKLNEEPIAFNPTTLDSTINDPTEAIRIFKNKTSYKTRRKTDERTQLPLPNRNKESTDARNLNVLIKTNNLENKVGIYITTQPPTGIHLNTHNETTLDEAAPTLNAICYALTKLPKDNLTFILTKPEVAKILLEENKTQENTNWLNCENKIYWCTMLALLRQRGAITLFATKNKKHNKHYQNLENIMKRQQPINWETPKPNETYLQDGVPLLSLNQKTTYQITIKEKNINPYTRNSTKTNIKQTQKYLYNQYKTYIPFKEIWNKQRNKIIPKNISDFIWKLTHGAIKCGKFFAKIPNLSERQYCSCKLTETPEHIMFQCTQNGTPTIWKHIETTWKKIHPDTNWVIPNIDTVQAICFTKLKSSDNKINKSASLLYQHLVMETIWILWKARNKRKIANKKITTETLLKMWKQSIHNRMMVEWTKIAKQTYQKQESSKQNFQNTWLPNNILGKIEKETLKTNIHDP